MSIFFNNNFGLNNNIENKTGKNEAIIAGKMVNLPEYITALKEGSIFRGEILDIRNNAVKILLGSNDILNARTDGQAQLNIGDILDFRVESNTGLNMLVKAVSVSNVNNNNMLMNALQSAEVPVNERNLSLVKELIDNGQPIDKQTIRTVVNNLNSIKELDTETAVNMLKHNIPINKENVAQFIRYTDNNHKLIEAFNAVSDNVSDIVIDLGMNNNNPESIKVVNNILQTILGDRDISIDTIVNNLRHEDEIVFSQLVNVEESVKSEIKDNTSSVKMTDNIVSNENIFTDTVDNTSLETVVKEELQQPVKVNIHGAEVDIEVLKEEVKRLVKDNLLIKEEIFNLPEDRLKEELEKYYKDVERKTDKLIQILENAGMEKSSLSENASNIKSNLNFMNDMYNMALYMQFPVKFNEGEAHGDLYVLNRNRNKIKEKDVITAFLHLDMEHLGATDVSIKLEKDKLTTKFMLGDVISQDIVEEHLHELKQRLDEKGYSTTLLIEEVPNEEVPKPFEQVLMLSEPKNYIKRYTFDVRA